MSVNPVPAGFHTVAPNIIVENVDAAVSFYKQAFEAEEILRLSTPDGKVVHCELKLGDSRVNLGESMKGWPVHPLLAQIFVSDSDAVFAQAVKAGAEVFSPMTDMFFWLTRRAHSRSISAAHGRFRRTRKTSRLCNAASTLSLAE
jgi:PhnB protein